MQVQYTKKPFKNLSYNILTIAKLATYSRSLIYLIYIIKALFQYFNH